MKITKDSIEIQFEKIAVISSLLKGLSGFFSI